MQKKLLAYSRETFNTHKINKAEKLIFIAEKNSKEDLKLEVIGDLSKVLRNFSEKQEKLRRNDLEHKQIRTALILGTGGMKGVFIAGALSALYSLGITEGIDDVIGVSTGATCGLYLLSDAVEQNASIYYDDLPKNNFINLLRFRKGIMNMSFLEEIFRTHKPVNMDKVRQSRMNLHIGVTNRNTGKGTFFHSKDESIDPISAVMASVNLPVYSSKSFVKIKGNKYVDGGLAHPLPIRYAIEELKATDILIIDTHIPGKKQKLSTRNIEKISTALLPCEIKTQFKSRYERRNSEIEYAFNPPHGVNIAVIYPESMPIKLFSKDARALKKTYEESIKAANELLSKHMP